MMTSGRARILASEDIAGSAEFRHLSTIAGIAVELRYASVNNFIGRDLYSPFDCAWLHRDAAAALERVVAWLAARRPGCTPLVLDALRPIFADASKKKIVPGGPDGGSTRASTFCGTPGPGAGARPIAEPTSRK